MGPFILIGLALFLILIIISVCAYPFLCASIAVTGKKYNRIVTGFLLLFTVAAYMLVCTTLEYPLNDWCYSVYAGIVLTPVVLYVCTGVEDPSNWLDSLDEIKHNKITIPLLTILTSSLFAIEGIMRMNHSYSIHRLLNYGWSNPVEDYYWFYPDGFKYAGVLLFAVSIISILFIGISFRRFYKEYKRNLAVEIEKKSRVEGEINIVTQRLKADNALLETFDTHQINEEALHYNFFCKTIVAALESSDEMAGYTIDYSPFNDIRTPFKVLLIKNKNKSFYFYPMGIVIKNVNDVYKYIPIGSTMVSLKTERKNMSKALPGDVHPILQTWLHTCRDGSPDLRYNYNPKTYVYEYANLGISELVLHVYRMSSAKYVVSAYNRMYSYITKIKAVKHNDIMNVSSAEKVVNSIDVLENKVDNNNVEQVNEVKTPEQHIAYNPPITLEECFCDIIRRRSVAILKDKNLVNCLTSMYKEVDITEYKDVMEKMVNETFLYQFIETDKQNDFVFYNLSNDFARKHKLSVQKSLFITQALVKAIKKVKK